MDSEQKNRIFELFEAVREGVATEEQLSRLDQLLAQNKTICKYYLEYFNMCALLKTGKAVDRDHAAIPEMNDSFRNMYLWKELLQEEKTSPTIEICPTPSQAEPVHKIVRPKVNYVMSRGSLISLLSAAAAILLLIIYVYVVPVPISVEVATLTDSMQTKWVDFNISMPNGTRLCAGRSPLILREGFVELLFDTNARVVIEAPAEFQVLSQDQIDLRYGKIFAAIPPEAVGFKINSPSAQVIDLGTEFGIEADLNGNTYLQMIKGRTVLLTGEGHDKINMEVNAGTAKKVFAETQIVADIPYHGTKFVRTFNSAKKIVWRGQPSMDSEAVRGYDRWLAYSQELRQDPDLILYYPFLKADAPQETAANYAIRTGREFDGRLGGSFGISKFAGPAWTSGRWPDKAALQFERNKRTCLVVPESEVLNNKGRLTLAAWVHCPDKQKGGHLFSSRQDDRINYQFGCFSQEDPYYTNKLQFLRTGTGESSGVYSSRPFAWTSEWTFLAVTYDTQKVCFYVNGDPFESMPYVSNQQNVSSPLFIGDVPAIDGQGFGYAAFQGIVDEIAVLKRALSEQEIRRMYETGKP